MRNSSLQLYGKYTVTTHKNINYGKTVSFGWPPKWLQCVHKRKSLQVHVHVKATIMLHGPTVHLDLEILRERIIQKGQQYSDQRLDAEAKDLVHHYV